MPWARTGDTSWSYPRLLAVEALPDAPPGAKALMFGFISALAVNSAAWKSDYIVHAGHIIDAGGATHEWLLAAALRTGLLTKHKARLFGVQAYQIVADPEFIHIRLKAELDWEAQQRNDTRDLRLSVPVRARDGDLCRYCGVPVHWMGRKSNRKATLDHTMPYDADGNRPPATVDTIVVACLGCNSELKDAAGEQRDHLRPPPQNPFYSATTAAWLTKNGRPTDPTDGSAGQRPAPADTAPAARKRPTTVDTARTHAASDPAPAGHRAATTIGGHGRDSPRLNDIHQVDDRDSAGTGRGGTGKPSSSSGAARPAAGARRRRRSRRGKPPAQREESE